MSRIRLMSAFMAALLTCGVPGTLRAQWRNTPFDTDTWRLPEPRDLRNTPFDPGTWRVGPRPSQSVSGLTVLTSPHMDREGNIYNGTTRSDYPRQVVARGELRHDGNGQGWWYSNYTDSGGRVNSPVRAFERYDRPVQLVEVSNVIMLHNQLTFDFSYAVFTEQGGWEHFTIPPGGSRWHRSLLRTPDPNNTRPRLLVRFDNLDGPAVNFVSLPVAGSRWVGPLPSPASVARPFRVVLRYGTLVLEG